MPWFPQSGLRTAGAWPLARLGLRSAAANFFGDWEQPAHSTQRAALELSSVVEVKCIWNAAHGLLDVDAEVVVLAA